MIVFAGRINGLRASKRPEAEIVAGEIHPLYGGACNALRKPLKPQRKIEGL